MKNPFLLFPAAVTWLITSIILLTLPGSDLPEEDWMDKIWMDKWVHIGMFAIMVTLWCLAWRSIKKNAASSNLKRAFIIIATCCLGYGILMEFVQLYFTADRSFDYTDIAADVVGCIIGIVFSTRRYIKK